MSGLHTTFLSLILIFLRGTVGGRVRGAGAVSPRGAEPGRSEALNPAEGPLCATSILQPQLPILGCGWLCFTCATQLHWQVSVGNNSFKRALYTKQHQLRPGVLPALKGLLVAPSHDAIISSAEKPSYPATMLELSTQLSL